MKYDIKDLLKLKDKLILQRDIVECRIRAIDRVIQDTQEDRAFDKERILSILRD